MLGAKRVFHTNVHIVYQNITKITELAKWHTNCMTWFSSILKFSSWRWSGFNVAVDGFFMRSELPKTKVISFLFETTWAASGKNWEKLSLHSLFHFPAENPISKRRRNARNEGYSLKQLTLTWLDLPLGEILTIDAADTCLRILTF